MALDIKTLRIGSSVLFNDKRVKITAIDNTDDVPFVKTSFRDDKWLHAKLIDPIPLTPEIVEELGFEKSEDANFPPYNLKGEYQDPQCKRFIQDCLENPELAKEFSNQKFCYLWHLENEEKQEIWKISCEKGSMEITYLHELENMYHYMTGREL